MCGQSAGGTELSGIGAQPQSQSCRFEGTIRTVPGLLAKSTAWKDYDDGYGPLEAAIKQLAKSMRRAA